MQLPSSGGNQLTWSFKATRVIRLVFIDRNIKRKHALMCCLFPQQGNDPKCTKVVQCLCQLYLPLKSVNLNLSEYLYYWFINVSSS